VDDVTPVVAALMKSGFPLQARVEHEIEARGASGWKLLASEYPWRDPDGEDQFVDLIANCGCVVLVIECKKAQERSLSFLRPVGRETTGLVRTTTLLHLEQNQGAGRPFGIAPRDVDLDPASYRAQFCVSTEKSSQRLLEPDARAGVLAAEAVVERFPQAELPSRTFAIPTIVTTAPLYTLRFEPTEVSLDTGSFTDFDPRAIEAISWIRFHKTFTVQTGLPRTVFVVNASALPTFLDEVSRGQGLGPARRC
jgi:hypothetical protein